MTKVARCLAVVMAFLAVADTSSHAQEPEPELERPAPPALDDFENDENKDGVPDGWYNARDAVIVAEGGKVRPHCLKFETHKSGRPARLSRAFGIDGRKSEAIVVGLWIRLDQIQNGERVGEEPGLVIDFLGDGLRSLRRGAMGPWAKTVGPQWTHVSKRIPVPPGTRDAIMSVGLLGATGVLEIDGITFELIPVDGKPVTNLVNNPGFELGDPSPTLWSAENGAHRVFPGFGSTAALELVKSGARVLTGLAVPVEPFNALSVSVMVQGKGLRGSGGAMGKVFFLDADGGMVQSARGNLPDFRWNGTFDWQADRAQVPVPQGAVRAVLQFEKSDGNGLVRIDDVNVTASPNPADGSWTPGQVDSDTTGWSPVTPSTGIVAQSALDASYLLDAPAGKHGPVVVKDGRLTFAKGGRARFFGTALLAPAAYVEAKKADELADRLARSGINLVRLGDLDSPLGPDRSLFDDSRDDTKSFDPVALARLDHLIAALKARGIYVALELQSTRRFRAEDGVMAESALPPGGGPAAEFDPTITKLARESARALLAHVNPETGLALRDDPVLAWVTLAGEVSLFDQIDSPSTLPPDYATKLRILATKSNAVNGRRFWQTLGSSHWKSLADTLRKDQLKAPIAGVSHWRRESEFSAEQASEGLDLIDDRLYWLPSPWVAPEHRSLLWSTDGGLAAGASRKRKADRPYVVGQWCDQTYGAWALPYEAADVLLASEIAAAEDWDALVRRGIFVHPKVWGAAAAGTGEDQEDLFAIPEVINGMPQVFALWPHAASILLRPAPPPKATQEPATRRTTPKSRTTVPGWEPTKGRLTIHTPFTQGVAGWTDAQPASSENLTITSETPYAVVVASSASAKPLATTDRLLVTALARVEPTGFRWVDEWKRDVAEPGTPPLLREPVQARVLWKHKGKIKAYALDNTGARTGPVKLKETSEGAEMTIDGLNSSIHWELVAE